MHLQKHQFKSLCRLVIDYLTVFTWLISDLSLFSGFKIKQKLKEFSSILKGELELPYIFSSVEYRKNFPPSATGFKVPFLHYLHTAKGWNPITSFDAAYLRSRPDVVNYSRSTLIHFLKHNRDFQFKDYIDKLDTKNYFSDESLELMFPKFTGFGQIKSIVIQIDSCAQINFYSLEALAEAGPTRIDLERKWHKFEDCEKNGVQIKTHIQDGILYLRYWRHKNLYLNMRVLLALISFNWDENSFFSDSETPDIHQHENLQSNLELMSSWSERYKTLNACQSENLSSTLKTFGNADKNNSRMAIRPYFHRKEKKKTPKVLIVAHEDKLSGAPLIARDIAKYYMSIGMAVKVVVVEGDAEGGIFANEGMEVETLSQRQEKKGVYAPTNTGWILTPQSKDSLLEIIDEFSPDVAILNSLASADAQGSLSSRLIPTIVYTHENWAKSWAKRAPSLGSQYQFMTLVKRAMDRSHLSLFASQDSLDAWQEVVCNERLFAVHTIQNCKADSKLIRVALRKNTRANLRIPLNAKVILAVGVFEPRKRIENIIEAFLKFDEKDSYLILLGQAGYFLEYESELSRLAKQSDRIIVHSLVADVKPFYASADIFVHASEEEVFPLVLQEAAAWTLPIICSNYGGVDELLGKGHPYIFPIGDVNSLIAMIREVYSNLESASLFSEEIHTEMHHQITSYRESLKKVISDIIDSQIFLRTESN